MNFILGIVWCAVIAFVGAGILWFCNVVVFFGDWSYVGLVRNIFWTLIIIRVLVVLGKGLSGIRVD